MVPLLMRRSVGCGTGCFPADEAPSLLVRKLSVGSRHSVLPLESTRSTAHLGRMVINGTADILNCGFLLCNSENAFVIVSLAPHLNVGLLKLRNENLALGPLTTIKARREGNGKLSR